MKYKVNKITLSSNDEIISEKEYDPPINWDFSSIAEETEEIIDTSSIRSGYGFECGWSFEKLEGDVKCGYEVVE